MAVRRFSPISIVIGLSFGPAVAQGMARFAYALLLPAMQADLTLSYARAGALNTSNAIGYFLGAVASAHLMRTIGVVRIFGLSMVLTAIFLILSGCTGDYNLLFALRLLAGTSSAITFIAGGAIATALTGRDPARTGLILGIYYGGAGLGILASGALIPVWLSTHPPSAWRDAWIALGILSLLASVATILVAARAEYKTAPSSVRAKPRLQLLKPALVAHFLFAFGYIGYMTFIIAYLRGFERSVYEVVSFWMILGGAVIVGAFVWGRFISVSRNGAALSTILLFVAVGSFVPLISTDFAYLGASAILFGLGFLSEIAAITALIRVFLAPPEWPEAIAVSVTVFSVGQSIGPVATGWLSDRYGSLAVALGISAGVVFVGAIIARMQRPHAQHATLVTPSA